MVDVTREDSAQAVSDRSYVEVVSHGHETEPSSSLCVQGRFQRAFTRPCPLEKPPVEVALTTLLLI